MISSREELYDVQDEIIDRYGDIPKETGNLLAIALLKSQAAKASITQLSIRDGEMRFVFDENAPIDGAKLISTAEKIGGAQMLYSELPTLVVRKPRQEVSKLYALAPQYVYMLSDCLSEAK